MSDKQNIEQKYIRATVKFLCIDEFYFEITPKDILGRILSFFNSQYIKIDILDFDKKFLIKTNNSNKLKSLLSDSDIRNRIENFNEINLLISKFNGIWEEELPDGINELSFF